MNWKQIIGFEDYDVSDTGLVRWGYDRPRRAGATPGRIQKGQLTNCGYRQLVLRLDRVSYPRTSHRLVLEAFGPPPRPGQNECNHIDGDKDNNHISNLEWCTSSENQLHAIATGLVNHDYLRGERNQHSKLTQLQVGAIRYEYAMVRTSQTGLARRYGVTRPAIGHIVCNRRWKDTPAEASVARS